MVTLIQCINTNWYWLGPALCIVALAGLFKVVMDLFCDLKRDLEELSE